MYATNTPQELGELVFSLFCLQAADIQVPFFEP